MDFLREGLKVLAEAIIELEVSSMTAAERYERSAERTTYRSGQGSPVIPVARGATLGM
jgi:transposase-like protein